MDNKVKITIHPQNHTLWLSQGANLGQGLRQQGILLAQPCGGQAKCGKCKIKLLHGDNLPSPTPDEQKMLTSQEIRENIRLACCLSVTHDLELELLQPQPEAQVGLEPIRKLLISPSPLPSPPGGEGWVRGVSDRLLTGQPLPVFTLQPAIERQFLAAEYCLGLAIDIGTTTLDIALIDSIRGSVSGEISALNPQIPYGMDVLSRISSCQDNPAMVKQLQKLVIERINRLVRQLCQGLGREPGHIYQAAVVGNPTMLHLFAGVDPKPLGQAPYQPVFIEERCLSPEAAGLHIHLQGQVILLPSISAFVGADTVAGVVAAGMLDAAESALFMDLGTNGEVVLKAGGKLWATACAAGPALEGMNIACGLRAAPGAIERVSLDGGISYQTIGGQLPPIGICGSGVIDLSAQMVRHGLTDKRGKLVKSPLIAEVNGQPALILFQDGARRIYFTQHDFRQVQLARGAIGSAIEVLLTQAGLPPSQIDHTFIAGAFGSSIREESLRQLGLLPPQFTGKTVFLGNAAKTGAILALLDSSRRCQTRQIAQEVTPVELSTYPDYQRILAKNLLFYSATR